MPSIIKKVINDSAFVFAAKIFILALGFFTNYYIANNYDKESLGELTLFASYVALISVVTLIGFNTYVLKQIPYLKITYIKKWREKAGQLYIGVVCILLIIWAISIFLFIVVLNQFGDQLDNQFTSFIVKYWIFEFSITLILLNISTVNLSFLRALGCNFQFIIQQVVGPLISVILLVVLTYKFYNFDTPKYSFVISIIFSFILSTLAVTKILGVRNIKRSPDFFQLCKDSLSTSVPMMFTSVMAIAMNQIDNIMISEYLGYGDVAEYAIASKIGMIGSFILMSFNMILAPKFSMLNSLGEKDKLFILASNSSTVIALISVPVLLFIVIFGNFVLSLFGEVYTQAYIALILIAIGQFISSCFGAVGNLMNMIGFHKELNIIFFIAMLVNIVLNYTLIGKFGYEGAALASLVATLCWNVCCVIYIKKKMGYYVGFRLRLINEK